MSAIRFDTALVGGAQVVLAVAGAWAVLLLLAAAVESVTRGRVRALARVGCPPAWRPALLCALGVLVSVAGASGGAAHAAPRGVEGPDVVPGAGLLPVPTRPHDQRHDQPPDQHDSSLGDAPAVVVVAPGDSLWAIARARLGAAAPAAQVQALTVALHHANRVQIGPDPDLLHPGQQLRLPADPATTPREDRLP
ncbi:LysM peptidoglycan-binding domain-containing protein [Nocardioides marmoraquaticus]